jgi:tetratricopeptide (TPR) repeat protein
VAAVAGRAFRPDTIQALLPQRTASEIAALLDDLTARDLITPVEGGMYTFRHILFRDVAYGGLSRAERVRLHGAMAAWLEAYATDRLDEFVELIAYHYREAVLLARQAVVPLALPVDPANAVRYLELAGERAYQAGAFAEALDYLQSAVALTSGSAQARLNELLGDYTPYYLDTGEQAYQAARDYWETVDDGVPDVLTVRARVLSKLLQLYLQGAKRPNDEPSDVDFTAMRAHANQLAHASGDEEQIWRTRIIDLYWWCVMPPRPTAEEVALAREISSAAADYYEVRANWVEVHNVLDAFSGVLRRSGLYAEGVNVNLRRLSVGGPSPLLRGDAIKELVHDYFNLGTYQRSVATMHEALAQVRPGDSVVHLSNAALIATYAAVVSGRWSDAETFVAVVEQAYEQIQDSPGTPSVWLRTFALWVNFEVLHIALAREDRQRAEKAARTIEAVVTSQSFVPSPPVKKDFPATRLAAYREDSPAALDLQPPNSPGLYYPDGWVLPFLSERGPSAPVALLAFVRAQTEIGPVDLSIRYLAVAEALAAGDDAQLAAAIDEAEAHELIPHAARMCIVLAQRTGDRSHLERARPVLERLGDRQFLQRLEEVQATLE